jgi:hypothetical protein
LNKWLNKIRTVPIIYLIIKESENKKLWNKMNSIRYWELKNV